MIPRLCASPGCHQPVEVDVVQDIDLRPLAELEAAERAFLSFYASGAEGLRALDDRVARIRRLLDDEPAEREHFEASLSLLQQWLDEHPPADQGLAVFTCAALDLAQGWHLPVVVPSLLWVGASPYLRPLAELQDEYGTLAVVAADNHATRIHTVTVSGASLDGSVRGDVKNAVKKGGWSQKRYARRREKQLERYADEVVQVLQTLDQERHFDRIVLLGSDESLREIRAQLPESLLQRVVGTQPIDLHEGEASLVEAGWQQWFAQEREEEGRLWDQIRDEALKHGLAVLGPTDTLAAAQAGRVSKMIVDRHAKIDGTGCRACEHVVHGTPQTCQSCGSADVFPVDLVDELVRLTVRTSAEVEFSETIPALAEEGGVGALLRY
jgi:peptide subunit release factor 1 (eRF1)